MSKFQQTKMERMYLAHDLCKFIHIKEISENFSSFQNFLEASTSEAVTDIYNYENLEVLGDSVIKILCSLYLFYKYPEKKEGFLEKIRVKMIYNENLFDLAEEVGISKFIYSNEYNINTWENPFFKKKMSKIVQQITKKNLADALEALVGACLLNQENFISCFNFLKSFKLFDDKDQKQLTCKINLQENENLIFPKIVNHINIFINANIKNLEDLLISNEYYNEISSSLTSDISFFNLFNLNRINYLQKSKTQNSKKIFYDKDYLCVENDPNFDFLQKEILEYEFKDVSLLEEAITHKSKSNTKNYERLEFLGDAILEIFTIFSMYFLSNKNFDLAKNLNCGKMTNVKSFLVSNQNLINISILLNMDKYLIYSENKIKDMIDEYKNNLNLEFKLDYYQETLNKRPKVLSDIFEAIVGAIFIDSGITESFLFLKRIFSPFICYCCKYINNIKFSVVSELVQFVSHHFKEQIIFQKIEDIEENPPNKENKTTNRIVKIQIILRGKMFHSAEGNTEEIAKEICSREALEKLKIEISEKNLNNNDNSYSFDKTN